MYVQGFIVPVPADKQDAIARTLDAAARALEEAVLQNRLQPIAPEKRRAPVAPARPAWQAALPSAARSDFDALLSGFRPVDPSSDPVAMRRELKGLVGIDATQLPPRVALRR